MPLPACSSPTSNGPKRIQTVMGPAKIALTFDLYGHRLSKYAFRARL